MELTAEKVHETFMNCLFSEGEATDQYTAAEGVRRVARFHPQRLKEAESTIADLLDELPDKFKKTGGGGWTFLNFCKDKHGKQWADSHMTMEELVLLGIATGKVEFQMPRLVWPALPGGMPYLVIN